MKKAKIILSLIFAAMSCLFISAAIGATYPLALAAVLFLGSLVVSYTMPTDEMAMVLCGQISACITPDCTYPIIGGMEINVYLANRDDVNDTTNSTITNVNPLLITNWIMTTPKFYTWTGIKTSNNSKEAIIKTKLFTNFDHELTMLVADVSAAGKAQLEALARGLVVAIIEYKYKGNAGASAYGVLGLGQGLELSALARDTDNADSQGGYVITLKTPAGLSEPHLPANIWSTNYATTQAIVEALAATCS